MAFDVQAARKAGYTDDEIADFLGNQSKFDVAGARKAGYTAPEIVGFLSQAANDAKPDQGLTPLDTEQVTSARPWQGAGAGRGSPNDPRRVDVERKPEGGLLNEARQLRDETLMGVQQTGAAVSNINAFGQANRLANTEQLIRDLEARGRGDSRAANQLRAEVQSLQERLPATIGTAADANALSQAASQMTTRPAIRKVGDAKTFGEAWEAFKESPYDVIAGVTAQSLPQVLPGLIAAAVTGPAAGAAAMGLNSGAVEFGGSLTEFAQDKGVDTRNAKAVQGFYSDPGNLSEALKYAGTRAGIIGTVDAASGGIAGKTLAPALRSPIKRQAINLPAQMAVQGAAGGGGEAGAQLATKGEIDQPGQVLLEVAGELGGAPAEVAAFTRDSARAATTPSAEAARALSTELDAGQLDSARVETLNPNLAIQRKTQEGLINIGAAQTVDDAIAAAAQATAPTPQTKAVDNIARLLGETPDVSQPGNIPAVDSGSPGLGAPEPTIGVDTGVGVSGVAERTMDAGSAGNQPDGGTVPLGDGGATPALSPDIADTASRIRELEGAQRGEPASMWFGRRGDGYQTPEDASAALPSRQRVSPDLEWKVEQMPSGRYRLAGYDTQTQQPASFKVTLNPTGTATIIGNPDAIKAKLAEAGIDKVMSGADRVIVGTSQALAAVQVLQQNQPPALANTAQPAINSVAETSEIARLRQAVEDAPPITQQHIDAIKTLRAAVTKDAQDALSQGVMPVYVSNTGLTQVITPSAQRKGMYQVTRYNDTGAIGDSQYNSLEEAIRDNQIDQDRLPPEQADAHMQKLVEAEAEYQRKRSARDQNQPTREDTQAQAPAAEAPAPAGSDAPGAAAVPAPAGPAQVEGGRLNHKETPPEPGIYKLANGAFAKFDDGMWTRSESDPKAAMRSQMFIPGNMKPADREADQAWQFHSGFTRDAMGEPARLKPAKATNPPTQAQAGTPAEGAGESRPAPVAAPEPTAEQKIRQAFDAAPRTIGNWHKLTVEHNGKTQEFLANMKRVNTSGKRDSAIHLVNIRPGRLMAGDPLQDLAYYYKLDGKNNLVEEGIPSIATPEQLKAFGRPDPRLIPVSQRKQADGFENLLSLKSTKLILDDGRGRKLYDVQVTPAFRNRHFVNGRMPVVNGLELKHKADVTGVPSDNGWVLIDNREQLASRNVPKNQANLNTSAEPAQKTPESEQVEANDLTPKQYHDARLRKMSEDTGTPLAEVREFYDTEGGRAESDRLWSVMVDKRARDGATLTRQTLDKFYELNPTARLPETAFPNGYQRPDARKQEAIAKEAIRQDRREAKAARAASEEQTGPYGRDLTPIAQGGKPFKTLEEAKDFRKKNTNNMVVKKVGKNQYVLQDASPKQIAAWTKAGKRLGIPQTGGEGPQHAHGFLIGKGGLSKTLMADAGFDRNKRFGNRTLFADDGMNAERATELLVEAGYLREGASHNDMFNLVRKSVQTPQYTSDGWEQLAQAEQSTRFEDHLAVEQEAATEEDPFGPVEAFTPAEIAVVPKNIREEYAALMEAAEAAGVDVDAILEEAARITENQTQEQFNEYVRQALTDAIANSRRQADRGESAVHGREDAERGGTEGSRQDAGRPGAQEEGLTAPTPAQVLEQQDRANRAEELDQREQIQREAEGFQLQAQAPEQRSDNTGDMFGGPSVEDYQKSMERSRKPGAAPEGPDLFSAPAEPEPQQPAPEPEPERFAAGKALTKEQRKQVLATLTDVYKTKRAERELKGVGRDGNERYGYVHSPELFEKSDITGAMVRYYVTLPDGKIAHPTELFPDYTQSDIDAEMQARETRKRDRKSDVLRATVPAQQFSTIQEATEWWDKRSRESARTATGLPTIFPASERNPLTDGKKIILIPNTSSAEMVEAFADEGWTPWKTSAAEPAKPEAAKPERDQITQDLIAARKRVSVLESLRECLGA